MNKQAIEDVLRFVSDLKKQVSDCEHEAEQQGDSENMLLEAAEKLSGIRTKYSDALFFYIALDSYLTFRR